MQITNVSKVLIRRKTDGKYLILTSSKWEENPLRSQKPDLPGGMVEVGERCVEGAARETREEAGISLAPDELQLVQAQSFIQPGGEISSNRLVYFAEVENPEVTISWEHESFAWCSADEVLRLDIREPYPELFRTLHEIGVLV